VALGPGGPIASQISGYDEIRVWWSAVGTLEGGGLVGNYSCVCCLTVGCANDGTRQRSSTSTTLDEVDGVWIW
jgi:hypothetical protein